MKTFLALFLFGFSLLGASEKLYFDYDEMPKDTDGFHIHLGQNEWIKTSCIQRDACGFYTEESNITFTANGVEFAKEWKCPYCHTFWPWGQPCGNPNCPSKFRSQKTLPRPKLWNG